MSVAVADRPTAANAALDLLARIGADHALDSAEFTALEPDASAALPRMWAAYERHWRGFCGSRLDPQFWHLDHPARLTGSIKVTDGSPIIVVGTGPSLKDALPELQRLRSHLHIFTSPRGADVLADAGIIPDLVIIEHQTALDAHLSLRDLAHRPSPALACVPLVAAEGRTPAALLEAVAPDKLFVPDPFPSWGLWPATAVALALHSGARSVALLGIDLGTRQLPDSRQAPLRDLLVLMAAHTDIPCMDLGTVGAPKPHWFGATTGLVASRVAAAPLRLHARPWSTPADRIAAATAAFHRLSPIAEYAAGTLEVACEVRDGERSASAIDSMTRGFARLLAAGSSKPMRIDLQDTLGLSFLPRSWRLPPDPSLGAGLWRPIALASHELVRQHEALGRKLRSRDE